MRSAIGASIGVFGSCALLVGVIGAASAPPPAAIAPTPDRAIDLAEAQREGARALARAIAALEAGDPAAAGKALEAAEAATPIADHVGLVRARWWLAKGRPGRAAEQAEQVSREVPDTPLAAELAALVGRARAEQGDEAAAQAAWGRALALEEDAPTRRALQREIVASRQRSGELPAEGDPDALVARVFPGAAVAAKDVVGRRTAEQSLRAADERVAQGRGAEAIELYREAIRGGLRGEALRDARLRQGIAMFRLRRYAEALPVFELLGLDPEARFWRARTLARLGRLQEAIVGFEALAGADAGALSERSAYLAATLLEDRGHPARAMAHYARVAAETGDRDRALDALWRMGWAAWKRGDDAEARRRFAEMADRSDDEIDRLRPLYWAARARERAGEAAAARADLEAIARGWPLSYYGWRAQSRLGRLDARAAGDEPPPPSDPPTLPDAALVRVALLLEADLDDAARTELRPLAARARTRTDHVRVGALLIAAGDYHRAQRLAVEGYGVPLARGLRPGDESLLWLSWPPAYRELVEQSVAGLERVDPALVWAIMREESGFRPDVMSSAGAMGLLQIMPETARLQAKRSGLAPIERDDELFEPRVNIGLGSAYLAHLASRFPDRPSAAIGGYNAGPNAVARWLQGDGGRLADDEWVEDIPYVQTRRYVKRVLRSLHVYRTFY